MENTIHYPKTLILRNGESLVLREAKKEDAARLIKYYNEVAGETDFLSFGAGEFNKSLEEEEKIIEDYKNAPNRIFLLAELQNELAGAITLDANMKTRHKHVGEFGIVVPKQHWGKGIGRILMDNMLEWSRQTGILRKIVLKVSINNHLAIDWYKKYGFETEGRIRRDSYLNGQFFDTLIMGLLID